MNKPTEEWTVQVVANLVFVNAPNRCVAITHNNSCEPSKQSLEDAEEICRLHNALTVPEDDLSALCAAKDELLAGAIEDIEAAKQRRVLTEATLDRVQRERDELRAELEGLVRRIESEMKRFPIVEQQKRRAYITQARAALEKAGRGVEGGGE